MTPMIDVVFQLIIFFIVTINMSEAKDKEVYLDLAEHGEEVDTSDTSVSALIVDVNRKGRVSVADQTLNGQQLYNMVLSRVARQGQSFQIWIRGDADASHDHIRKVMDTCTAAGVPHVTFLAIKDPRTPETKLFLSSNRKTRRAR